ncbi:hypothetical protein [Longimicrobium sp.]|uniref:hypothetical protein n=1 Tax=Longimicrobium sp. TaxID=2029185 RepID=UPI002C06B92D|nr:hypothetical protein [Longimicrobium sp.]HSU12766.1 hypothetical protein [Longimicrobium sp.]
MRRGTLVVIAALPLLGCTHAGSATATLRPVCAPNDAAAVLLEVLAAAPEQPRFRLRLSRPLGEVTGRRVEVRDPGDPDVDAQWCDADGCSVIRSAMPTTADFGALQGDSSVSVRVRAARPDGTPFAWAGVARWKGETLVCG